MGVDIDRDLSGLIARRQPAARDLRSLVAYLKTIGHLERIGDEAVRIARTVQRFLDSGVSKSTPLPVADIGVIGKLAMTQLRHALNAFASLDVARARERLIRRACTNGCATSSMVKATRVAPPDGPARSAEARVGRGHPALAGVRYALARSRFCRPQPMKKLLASALALVGISASGQAPQAVIVDEAHSQLTAAQDAVVPRYTLTAATSLVVDARNYIFKMPFELTANRLNSLQLVQGNDRQYSVAWNPATSIVTVSADNAHANHGSKPFSGLVAGESVVIAIGVMDDRSFKPAWVGMAQVK